MANRNYQFYVYESNLFNKDVHPVTGIATPGIHTAVANITGVISNKRISLGLNNGGQVSFSLSLDAKEALDIVDYEIRRCLVVFVDDDAGVPIPRWSGPIWNIDLSTSGGMSVTAVGWQELFNHRELRKAAYYTDTDAGVIATRLLTTINGQNSNQNVVPATSSASSNSQRTGVNTGGLNGEDLLFGAGDFEYIGDVYTKNSSDHNAVSISNEWAVSGANSLKISRTWTDPDQPGSVYHGYGARVQIPLGLSPDVSNSNSGLGFAPVEPSTVYEIKYSSKISSIIFGGLFPQTQVFIEFFNSSFISVGTSVSSGRQAVGTYINESLVATSPAGSAYASVYVQIAVPMKTGASITAYFDNMVMSKNAVNQVPSPIGVGTVSSPANPVGANRTRSYPVGQKIGLAIEELSQIEAGFDYEVAIASTVVSGGTTILRNMNIYYDTVKGTIKGKGVDRPNTIFGFRWGPNNLSSARKSRDSSRLANRINARSSSMLSMAQDPGSIALRGIMEESTQVSDAGVTPKTLLAYAGAEIVYRSVPMELYEVVPFPWDGDKTGPIPRLWVDYDIGDICYLVVDSGALKIGTSSPQAIRIFGLTISIDKEGNERVESMKTTYS